MKTPIIDFEEFSKRIDHIKSLLELQFSIDNAIHDYRKNISYDGEICLPTLEQDVIDLLSIIMDDENGWIPYYVYDLDFGRLYQDGTIINPDGTDVKLKTTQDLWNLLTGTERPESPYKF